MSNGIEPTGPNAAVSASLRAMIADQEGASAAFTAQLLSSGIESGGVNPDVTMGIVNNEEIQVQTMLSSFPPNLGSQVDASA